MWLLPVASVPQGQISVAVWWVQSDTGKHCLRFYTAEKHGVVATSCYWRKHQVSFVYWWEFASQESQACCQVLVWQAQDVEGTFSHQYPDTSLTHWDLLAFSSTWARWVAKLTDGDRLAAHITGTHGADVSNCQSRQCSQLDTHWHSTPCSRSPNFRGQILFRCTTSRRELPLLEEWCRVR